MKKLTRLLVFVLSLVLLCGIFAVNAFADTTTGTSTNGAATVADDNVYKVVSGTSVKYYTESTPISTIISEASSGATIYLLRDVVVPTSSSIGIGKKLTFDFGGHTFTFEQHKKNCGFYINTTNVVTFQNGTVATVAHTDYNSSGNNFSFMNINKSGANVVVENINSNVSSLVYSYGTNYTFTVNGGRHVLNSPPGDMNTAGFISGQSNINATVNGAIIHTNGRNLFGASSYKAVAASITPETTFTFNNCSIIAPSVTTNLIGAANQYTTAYFNGCYIVGGFSPYLNNQDAGLSIKPSDSTHFIIGDQTFFSASSNIEVSSIPGASTSVRNVSKGVVIDGVAYEFNKVADTVKVVWCDENGNVLKSMKIDEITGTLAAVSPSYQGVGGASNDWYTVGGYIKNSWTTSLGGVTGIDLAAIDTSNITESLYLYPLAYHSALTPSITVAKYNLSTTGAIQNNLYLPETPEDIRIIGVYVGEREIKGRPVLFYDYDKAPVYYNMYVVNEIGAAEFTKVTEVTVKFEVGGKAVLEQIIKLSPESYANYIYADASKTEGRLYNDEAYKVVADLVRYSYLLSGYAGISNSALDTLYGKMSTLCSDLPSDNSLAGAITNASALSGTGSIAYEASSYEPRWKFTLNESAKIVDIKITLKGYYTATQADRSNFGDIEYGIENVTRNAAGYITIAYSNNIPLYNITNTFTITLIKDDGTELVGTYGLKSYYSMVAKNTSAADFLKSVFALAGSTTAYKFPNGKLTGDDVCDFWECDHNGAEKQETISTYIYNFAPRFCAKCDTWLFYYEDYGAVADGKTNRTRATHVSGTNDYEALYWTHKNANEWKAREDLSGGKHVAVVGNSDPAKAKYYYISLPEGRGIYTVDTNYDGIADTDYTGKNLGSIVIATDTSWNGVNLIIDDDAICNASGCSCVNAMGVARKHAYISQSIFVLDEHGAENYTASLTGRIKSLSAGATSIGYAPGRKMLIHLTDSNKKIYLRYGSNASNGASITEVILVDEFGNIDPSTPVQWDYATVTSAKAYTVDTDPIKVSGLDKNGSINSSYESYVNNSMSISIPHYVSCGRNITLNRSNATVEGIDRFFTEEVANSHVTNKRFAYTFIVASLCSNVTIKDMLVLNHNSQGGESGVGQGSYEFSGGTANAVSWINCVTKNMFSSSKDGSTPQAYPIYRGLFGTNHIRNMYLKDCYLNSFDAHTGAYNVTLEDTTVEHMNFIGGGDIKVKNVTVYCSNQGMAFNLRTDYGSTWKGNLYVDGLTVKYASTGSSKPSVITVLKGSYENQYWGFDTYMPQEVVINNFHTQAYTAVVSNGERIETPGAIDDSDMHVHYYYAIGGLSASRVPNESKPGLHGPTDKGDPNITYDYGTNHLEVTKSITITNSVRIILPSGSFWKNMVVTIDGVSKKWSGAGTVGNWI